MKLCSICGSIRSNVCRNLNGWELRQCSNCDLVYTDFTSNQKLMDVNRKVYDKSYVISYKSRKIELSERFRKYLDIIENYKVGGAILDIGCGVGYFVEVAGNSKISWDAYGVELNEYLVVEANKILKGKVKIGSLSRIPFPPKCFDCITCFDVLEHSVELNKNLTNIHKALKDDGILVVQSPNYRSLMQYITGNYWDWWALPDHVLHFSPDTLTKTLEKNGFTLRMIKTYEPLSDFIGNIKQLARKNVFTKVLFVMCLPVLFLNRFIAHRMGYGGLMFAIAQKA